MDHLHAELRFAVGRASGYCGGNAGRDTRIEEVDVKAHVQMAAVTTGPIQCLRHHRSHPKLVDLAHVIDDETAVYDQPLLNFVDGSYADLDNTIRFDHGDGVPERRQLRGTVSGDDRDRHAMEVAGRR